MAMKTYFLGQHHGTTGVCSSDACRSERPLDIIDLAGASALFAELNWYHICVVRIELFDFDTSSLVVIRYWSSAILLR
jgi:hypothetical protein